ncbi:MAG TPA: helix-turn-helix transcriptional regulator [Planctomycetota bacterium]|nr:helix-turn-helix transcriptional regulator [Planctomycetota bacterium]
MSRNGQRDCFSERPVAVIGFDFVQGASTGAHSHPVGQLVHAVTGVMRVTTSGGAWIVPPGRAVWVPTGVEHEVRMVTSVAMRTVYVEKEALPRAPAECCVVAVSPVLRELILEALRLPRPYPLGGAEERLVQVLLDRVSFRDVVPLHLPAPSSRDLVAIARALERDPSDSRTLAAWARAGRTSARTLARAFRRETGLAFGAWRAQLRLMTALELLALDHSVTDVALALGYDSTSAFIHSFRRHLGTTPARYFASEDAPVRSMQVSRDWRPPRAARNSGAAGK